MKTIIKFIKENDNFLITSHVSPDGDNIGSSIAMTKYLQNIGKTAYHFLDDNAPQNLSFITDRADIYKSNQISEKFRPNEYFLIVLDCGNKARVNVSEDIISNAKGIVCIDHHESNEYFGDINYVDKTASSTCELVYDFAKLYDEHSICELTATALYTGLATDTGHFKYDCTKISSFNMAGDLIRKNAKKQEVVKFIYQSDNYNYKKLEADLIINQMEKTDDICIMLLPQETLIKYDVDLKDTENLVNNTLNINGVEVGILLKEKEDGTIRGSLRSKERVNVNKIANIFGGGGHERAAGFTLRDTSLKESKELVINTIKELLNK